jgi:hypothetical protein
LAGAAVMAGVRAIPISEQIAGRCQDCPTIYVIGDHGDARLRLMAHTKQTGHKTRVEIHSVTEFVVSE